MNKTKRAALAAAAVLALVISGCKSTEQEDANKLTSSTTASTSTTSKTTNSGGTSTTQKTTTTTTTNKSGNSTSKTGANSTTSGTSKTTTTTTTTGTNGSNGSKTGTNANNGTSSSTTTTTTTTTTKSSSGNTLSPDEWPENNKKLLAQVEKSRQKAIAAGAESAASLAFKTAEEEYNAEKDAVAKGQKVDLSKALADLDARYKGLEALAAAKQKKARIDQLNIASADQTSYDEGSSLVTELSSSKAAVYTGADFYKKANTANKDFDKVLSAAGLSSSTSSVDPATFPANNKRLFDQVEKSRQAAIDAGADKDLVDSFAAAEKIYTADKAIVDNGEQVDISASLRDLNNRYRAMATILAAQEKKAIIDENGFASYSMSNYTRGTDLLDEVTSSRADNLTGEQIFQKANLADASYAKVIDTAYRSLAEQERRAAYNAKRQAESVKAQISRKDDYMTGVNKYRSGYSMYTNRNPEGAVEEFKTSKETFLELYDVISKARAEALKKIEDAKKKVEHSENTAVQADKTAPLGNQPVKGIEAADAKLLEDDDFSYTENTEVEVDSTSLTPTEEVKE